MSQKKLSDKTYRLLETEGTHIADSKETQDARRGLEFDNKTNKLVGPVELVEVAAPSRKTYSDFSPLGRLVIDMTEIIVPRVTEYLTDKAISSFDNWLKNRRKRHLTAKPSDNILPKKTKAQQIPEQQKTQHVQQNQTAQSCKYEISLSEFDIAYKEYQTNMSCEELRKELLDIFVLTIIRAKKIWKVTHANIMDASLDKQALESQIKKLCDSKVIDNINLILCANPKLLDEWESVVLSEIIGRDLIKNNTYIPIERQTFEQQLLLA